MFLTPEQKAALATRCREFDWGSVEWERLPQSRLMDALSIVDMQPLYDPEFGDDRLCTCGHPYFRHFDSYEDMDPVGCKYCQCGAFVLVECQQKDE